MPVAFRRAISELNRRRSRTTSASPICLLARSTRKPARVASAEDVLALRRGAAMSALGQTRNFLTALALSAFPPVADQCPFLRQLEGPNSLDA